jgi:hypothetical protein
MFAGAGIVDAAGVGRAIGEAFVVAPWGIVHGRQRKTTISAAMITTATTPKIIAPRFVSRSGSGFLTRGSPVSDQAALRQKAYPYGAPA